jgi:L-aminopeptidase/D-esterase-like protein
MWDGDTMFALATGRSRLPGNMMVLCAIAAAVTSAAVVRAIEAAEGLDGPNLPRVPALRDL